MQSTEKKQDGSLLLDYRLPELMEDKTAGTKHWRTRREEIIRLLSQQEYGFIPPHLPANVKTTEKKRYLRERAFWKRRFSVLTTKAKALS